MTEQNLGRWYSGRTPPSKFEYTGINGFYSPKQAQVICEGDIQCGGFTFKGTKGVTNIVPEVYFFHFIDERSNYLTPEIQNSHWTSYIVGSRDHIVISGSYPSIDSNKWRKLSRYGNFFSMSYKREALWWQKYNKLSLLWRIFSLFQNIQLLCPKLSHYGTRSELGENNIISRIGF